MENDIQVGLVEDQVLFRKGIKAILSSWPDIHVVFESDDGHSVLEKLRTVPVLPDVMLVDLSLPPLEAQEYGGLHLTQHLVEQHPEIKIIILSVHDDENFINQLIEHGAHGYLVKDCDPQEVYDAIWSAHHKGSYINERTLKALQLNRSRKSAAKKPSLQITKREEEVLRLVCQQFTAEEIAEKLFISTKTVNGHRNNLLQKTGSRNATGLVVYAIRNGIISVV